MADLSVPSIMVDRSPNTKTTVKAEIANSPNIDIKNVPNFAAGWMNVAGAAFSLADTIDNTVNKTRAMNTLNDYRMNVDKITNDIILNNSAGMTDEELQAKVFETLDKYAEDNLLNEEFMNDPRIREAVTKEYNDFAMNIHKTLYADNATKVKKTELEVLSSRYMMSLNDAATAHNTPEGHKYEMIAKENHDMMLRAQGIDPEGDIGKLAWQKQKSNLLLNNVLQDLADPGMNPYGLLAKIKGEKGNMMIEDYTKAINAIRDRIEHLEIKAATKKQQDLSMFGASRGFASEIDKQAMIVRKADELRNLAKDPNSIYHGLTNQQIEAKAAAWVEEDQRLRREQFSAGTSFVWGVASGINKFLNPKDNTFPLETKKEIVEAITSVKGTDADVVLLSQGIDPRHATPDQIKAANDEIERNKFLANENDTFNSFYNIKYSLTASGIQSLPKNLAEGDRLVIDSMSDKEKIENARLAKGDIRVFMASTGLKDEMQARVSMAECYELAKEDSVNRDNEQLFDTIDRVTKSVLPKVEKSFDTNGRASRELKGRVRRAIERDITDRKMTLNDYATMVRRNGTSQIYLDNLLKYSDLSGIVKK